MSPSARPARARAPWRCRRRKPTAPRSLRGRASPLATGCRNPPGRTDGASRSRPAARSSRTRPALPRRQEDARERHDLALGLRLLLAFAQPILQLVGLGTERVELCLQLDDHLHAGEVDPALLREVLDLAEQRDVTVGVAPGVAGRALRRDEALALVDAERLRVHAGELCGDADDVDGAILVALLLVHHLSSPPTRLAATSRSPRPVARRASSAPSRASAARRR